MTPLHILGAAHSGAQELWEALAARLGASAVRLHAGPDCMALPRFTPNAPPALVLLMGLDWPCPSAEQPQREQQDARLRQGLASPPTPFRVLYGPLDRRIASALASLNEGKPKPQPDAAQASVQGSEPLALRSETRPDTRARLRAWGCEKCSDPVCEHRLFTSLKLGTAA